MGILSEIFAELSGALSPPPQPAKRGKAPSGKSDPFAKSSTAPKNVPISEQRTALEMHSARTGKKQNKLPRENSQTAEEMSNIKVAKPLVSASDVSISDMRKAVIMSEILGKPKCKR